MNELTGAALDAAVAEAEGLAVVFRGGQPALEFPFDPEGPANEFADDFRLMWRYFMPSSDWSQGGPIIEREQIDLESSTDGWFAIATRAEEGEGWGDTPLIAAMRAYVASKRTTDTGPQSSNEGGTAG